MEQYKFLRIPMYGTIGYPSMSEDEYAEIFGYFFLYIYLCFDCCLRFEEREAEMLFVLTL